MLASPAMNRENPPPTDIQDAYEIHGEIGASSVVVICEHASNRVPPPLQCNEDDQAALTSHWGWDIGVREASREVIHRLNGVGVMARFTRLVCDANRDPIQGTFIREHIEGRPLSFNQNLQDTEVDRRIQVYHNTYHQAIHDLLAKRIKHPERFILVSIHSFTPVWGNGIRDIDIGVLFSEFGGLAQQLAEQLRMEGYTLALNQPYSAANGMAYSVERHGQSYGLPFLELEINQARIGTPKEARKVGRDLAQAISRLVLPDPTHLPEAAQP